MVELSLNKTGAFKELIKHINFIWPGTFDSEKARYKKYREVSVDGCKLIGRGAKGNPWIFREAAAAVAGREIPARPSEEEVIDYIINEVYQTPLLKHFKETIDYPLFWHILFTRDLAIVLNKRILVKHLELGL
jgi:tRNA-dihydrouridine synthase